MLAALDLDQTLIYSRRSMRLPGGVPEPELVCVETYEGRSQSFLTRRAADLFVALAAVAVVVPTTTRTLAQLARVRLPAASRWAVAANGGHLLVDGEPDPDWAAGVRAGLADVAGLTAVQARVVSDPGLGWLAATLRSADALFLYALVDRAVVDAVPTSSLDPLTGWLVGAGWTLSVQGRKVYLVPAPLTKAAAIAEVQRRAGEPVLGAVGDALLDRDLLLLADHPARPPHGELHNAGWSCPGLFLGPRAGVLAAEDLLGHLLARAGVG